MLSVGGRQPLVELVHHELAALVDRSRGTLIVYSLGAVIEQPYEVVKYLLDEICRIALQDAESIGASLDDLMGLLSEFRRGDSPARRST